MPLPSPRFEDAKKDTQLKLLMHKYLNDNHNAENFAFYFSTEGDQVVYNKYVRAGAPEQVNLPTSVRKPLDEKAAAGEWSNMVAPMAAARKSIASMTAADVLTRFAQTDEYRRWYVAKNKKLTDEGNKALKLLTSFLKSLGSAAQLKALMLVVEGGRTPADRKAAYTAIQALVKDPKTVAGSFRVAKLDIPA
jgi:hypothetical protein